MPLGGLDHLVVLVLDINIGADELVDAGIAIVARTYMEKKTLQGSKDEDRRRASDEAQL